MAVKFTFGGVKREVRVELALAPKFEDATGLGFLALTKAVVDKTARLAAVVDVIRIALDANGTKLSHDEVFEQMQHDAAGVVNAFGAATAILMELCLRPEGADKGKKSLPATRGNRSASH